MMVISTEQLEKAVDVLKQGGVIIFPTETAYGLGADATNPKAVERIFAIKQRDRGKALPLIIPAGSAEKYVEVTETARKLMNAHWPGALNLILPSQANSPVSPLCGKDGTQSVRESSHPFASMLAKRLGAPITATSANLSGLDSLYSVSEALEMFNRVNEQPDLVIDAGTLPVRPASTTVAILGDEITILRQGAIIIEQ